MKRILALILLCLFVQHSQAQQLSGLPTSPFTVTGSSNPYGKWAGWMYGGKLQVVACTTDHCTDAVMNAAWWVWDRGLGLTDANAALTKYGAVSICETSVRAVWWNDRYKLKNKFNLTDTDLSTVCP